VSTICARHRRAATAALVAILLSGCGTNLGKWVPFVRADEPLAQSLPQGAVEHFCESNRRLIVRHEPDGRSVWVFHPDRQVRLERVGSGSDRFTNGVSTLSVQGEELALDEEGKRIASGCRRKPA